jgi:hypothetical protein
VDEEALAMRGRCHCGAVEFEVAAAPEWVGSCNCSICRRTGGLFAYYHPRDVTMLSAPGASQAYVWGDRCIALHHCRTCGCTTHWENLMPDGERMGVNARMIEELDLAAVPVKPIDGASY